MMVDPNIRYADLPSQARLVLDQVAMRAKNLLNANLTVTRDDGQVTVRITEVEAYGAEYDPAAHSFRGESKRNRSMFGPPNRAYVYRHMGLHHCFNVSAGSGCGVLIRAGEVVEGESIARTRRNRTGITKRSSDLAAGPARLTVALGITLADDGQPLDGSTGLLLRPQLTPATEIMVGTRIGVGKAKDFPLRFWLKNDPSLSR